eukprot:scaffold36200_cov15-Tisochrysis_lutea.AAC.1
MALFLCWDVTASNAKGQCCGLYVGMLPLVTPKGSGVVLVLGCRLAMPIGSGVVFILGYCR